MRSLRLAFALICLTLAGCGGDTIDSAPIDSGYRIAMQSVLTPAADGTLPIVTPAASVHRFEADFFIGKPWVGLVYAAGADIGTDAPLHREWGTVPDTLEFDYRPDRRFQPGAYDVLIVILSTGGITAEMKTLDLTELGPQYFEHAIGTFSFDLSAVRDADPEPLPGAIRYTVDDRDLSVVVENRWPTPEDPLEVWQAAFNNTYILLP